jgi:hypothetical protein
MPDLRTENPRVGGSTPPLGTTQLDESTGFSTKRRFEQGGAIPLAVCADWLAGRIAARYPAALPLPPRPELDALVEKIGLSIERKGLLVLGVNEGLGRDAAEILVRRFGRMDPGELDLRVPEACGVRQAPVAPPLSLDSA